MRPLLVLLFLTSILSTPLSAADLYIVRGNASGPFFNAVEYVTWGTEVFFTNHSDALATVQLVGISNDEMPDSRVAKSFSIDPHRSAVLSRDASASEWTPASVQIQTLWVIHLSVPNDLVVDDVMFIGRGAAGLGLPLPGDYPYYFGKLRLPMFSSLVPANHEQVHAATFLGSPSYIPSRTNVAIYNGGTAAATARIEIHDYCDDSVLTTTSVSVPANSIVQPSITTLRLSTASTNLRRLSTPWSRWISRVSASSRICQTAISR
jgi:hypothetical protein